MVEHRLVPERHAFERQGLELGQLRGELGVDVDVESERLVSTQRGGWPDDFCFREARCRGGRAQVMPTVRDNQPAHLAERGECLDDGLARRSRSMNQQPTVFEAHDRRSRSQPDAAEPNWALEAPDPFGDDVDESA